MERVVGGDFYLFATRLAGIGLVTALFYYALFFIPNGSPSNPSQSYLVLDGLVLFASVLFACKFFGLAKGSKSTIDRRLWVKLGIGLGVGLAATALSGFALIAHTLETSTYGFPFAFLTSNCTSGGCGDSASFFAFAVDYSFWLALVYPVISLVDSARAGRLKETSRLVAFGVSALLFIGTALALDGLFLVSPRFAAAFFSLHGLLGVAYPLAVFGIIFLTNAVSGLILFRTGARALGEVVVLGGLVYLLPFAFVLLLGV